MKVPVREALQHGIKNAPGVVPAAQLIEGFDREIGVAGRRSAVLIDLKSVPAVVLERFADRPGPVPVRKL